MTNSKTEGFDPTDPVGTWRTIRDANLDAWAKGMATMVNTETFSKALGAQLDTMLAASAPMQKMVSQYMEAYLAQANMPSRAEVISLAQRMTNIEMRLDDMDARLDDIFHAIRATPAPAAPVPAPAPNLDARLDEILQALRALPAATAEAAVDEDPAAEASDEATSAPRSSARRRKPAGE